MNMQLPGKCLNALNSTDKESVKIVLVGSQESVTRMIRVFHILRLSDPNDWSPPQRGKNSTEVVSLLVKRV
jgi:hypothetical protein